MKTETQQQSAPLSAIFKALGANFGIAVAKGTASFFTGSSAMLAEAIHSASDCMNQILLLIGLKEAKIPDSEEHPLGNGRATHVYALLVSIMIFAVGGLYSMYKGVLHIIHPEQVEHIGWLVGILFFSMLLEGYALSGGLKHASSEMKGKSFFQWVKETRSSELLIVICEDVAALLGLVIALLFVTLAYFTGDPRWDAAGSFFVGALLTTVGFVVFLEMKSLLIGESATPEREKAIREYIKAQPEIKELYRLITQQHGSKVFILIHAEMMTAGSDVFKIKDRIKAGIHKRFPEAEWVFIDSDKNKEVYEYDDEDDEI